MDDDEFSIDAAASRKGQSWEVCKYLLLLFLSKSAVKHELVKLLHGNYSFSTSALKATTIIITDVLFMGIKSVNIYIKQKTRITY